MRYGIDWKRTGRRGHCALLPEIRPNSLAAEFLNAYLDEVGNKPMEMWFVAVPREFWRKVWKKVGSACFCWLFYKESVYWYYIVSIYRFFIKKSTETGRTNFFPYFPSKFPWHSHESHLHRLIPHFVQIRIQKFRCKAVGTDFGQ